MHMELSVYASDISNSAKSQLERIAYLPPFSNERIAVMPDVHPGHNCIIGFTATISDKIIPNIVGSDIACGVLLVNFRQGKRGIDFQKLDKIIRSSIPAGVGKTHDMKYGLISPMPEDLSEKLRTLRCWDGLSGKHLFNDSFSTLGSGNHFIEIDKTKADKYTKTYEAEIKRKMESDTISEWWLTIHTGSRYLGSVVADYYQALAAEHGRIDKNGEEVPYSLCWLEGQDAVDYLHDMEIVSQYAQENRCAIAKNILKEMKWKENFRIDTPHNYISQKDNIAKMPIVRKGAIQAYDGQLIAIPLNMAQGILLCSGRGNKDWNYSAPHGCGRKLMRADAKTELSVSEYKKAMKDVWSSCVGIGTIDESPAAYKPPDLIIEETTDCADIMLCLEPKYNFKAET